MRITLSHLIVRLAIAAAIVAATTSISAQQQGATYEVVSVFDVNFVDGRSPSALRQSSDGMFYGTTQFGGLFDRGTLFRMDAAGTLTSLHSFSGPDGAQPFGLVQTPDGRFYGMTSQGGASGLGTVFSFTPGTAVTTLHSFTEMNTLPVDMLVSNDGNVYGLTAGGGDFGNGTIFQIDPAGSFSTIHSIALSAGSDMTSFIQGSDGRFYGTARLGGDIGHGTLFAIDSAGVPILLHSFAGQPTGDGDAPAGLIEAQDGRLYGLTRRGGDFSRGTVYVISPTGADYSVLHSFSESGAGADPAPHLLEASDGNFYGATRATGASLFRMTPSGTVTALNDVFFLSVGELIQALDGRLYAPAAGGPEGGSIISKDLAATTLTTVFRFRMGEGIGRPTSVMHTRDGLFYGTTSAAGDGLGVVTTGTIFSMDAAGTRTTLHTFIRVVSSLVFQGTPLSRLLEGADGNLYGTTFNPNDTFTGPGQIFRMTPAGAFTVLSSAHWLRAGLIEARDGRLYGTSSGGIINLDFRTYGDVFRIAANGARTVLHEFSGHDSAGPSAELLEIDDGSLYGTTVGGSFPPTPSSPPQPIPGAIFRFDPATGSFAIRHVFSGPDGSAPRSRLIQGTDGLIYGTTSGGGANGFGTIFSLDAAGTLTTLHHFAGPDGANPDAGVIQGHDGRLYGVTPNGGAFGFGTMFVMNVTGGLTTLHHFALSDGATPVNELIQANDGAFYGAAVAGGPGGGGVIFRLRVPESTPDQHYELVSRNSGKCLDVAFASTDAVAPLIQWICHGGANQQWRLEPAGGGAFRIIARHSGQALDVYGALLDDVTPIIQYPVHGGDNQAWMLEPASDGYVRIVARHSGKAMDVEFASPDDGARVIQYTPHGGANQQWLLRPVESPTLPVLTSRSR